MKALILSGGTGARMRPITFSTAKQLIPIANKPILHYIIEKIAEAGIRHIGIIVGDTREEIISSTGSGRNWNVDITYIHQLFPFGLAHAVKTAGDYLGESDFVMILGDNLFEMELAPLINNFYSNKSSATLLLHRADNPTGFGVAQVEYNEIVRLYEKPVTFISDLIITGVYVFSKDIFDAIENTAPSARGELEITDAIQKLIETGKKVTFEKTRGWWKDTGKLENLLEAHRHILDSPGTAGNRIKSNCLVDNCIIHEPVIIGSKAIIRNSTLGPYVSVGSEALIDGCKIEDSIILEQASLSNINGTISKSLIGRKAKITGNYCLSPSYSFFTGDYCEIRIGRK